MNKNEIIKKLIIIKEGKYMQFNKLDDLVDYVLGEEYKLNSQKEKLKIRYERAYTMCKMCKNVLVVHTDYGVLSDNYKFIKMEYNAKRDFIIDNDIEFLRSMSKLKIIILLERIGSNIFINNNLDNDENNYIWVK